MEEVVMVHEAKFEANPTGMNREMLQKVQAELIKCLALEEKYWQQKAGMTWFKEGDRNTKFFHAQVRGRRKRLQLNRIQNSGGTWIEEEQEIAEEAIKYYEEQFTEVATPSLFDILEHVPNLINTEQNAELIKQPTKEEVKVAVFGLNEEQAGFVTGRNIVENILLTQEIVTEIRLRTKAGPNVILKLDMTKAYDRLSWLFLTKAHGFFKSSRGVKQGDPVSPTLFILAAEALYRGLNALHTNLYFCGFGMPKWSPKINHLAYADDMIIFPSSDETSLMLIMQVLKAYEAASGQLVNKTKSAVYLHHLTDMEMASKVERITGIHRDDFPIIYLGCPIFYARRKLEFYQPLMTKVMDKLQSWQGKLLSVGGKAVLISHVLQSMPMHLLSAVNPPKYVINRLHKLFAQFFWSNTVGGTSRYWDSWNTLCMPVEEGGIGFRSLHDVAKALFSKLWWNFRTKPRLWSSFV
uniref:Uncharacterized protein LOC104242863 n=1 Tax=Nicotiana sylvestris TaxID=4096 RepID=A0A1U7YBV9_NICSY|nr:PREDICTED: uncharacterized protein LOC104242863 [Nicotiana sylvestris]